MQNVPAKVCRDAETEGVDIILPHKEKINAATETIRIQSELASSSITLTDMLPKFEFTGGIQKDSFNISVDNPQKIYFSWYIYQGSVLVEKGSGTEMEFKSKVEDRGQTYYDACLLFMER